MDRVGALPLALAQAASYMRETGTSMVEYLNFYNTAWNDLMKDEDCSGSGIPEYGNRSVYTTWDTSFEYVKRKNEDATNMLQVWSYLNNRDISFEIFNNEQNPDLAEWSSPPEWFCRVVCNKLSFKRIAATLLNCSLIEARYETDSYRVHPVVHEWCRKTLGVDRQLDSLFLAVTSVAFGVPNDDQKDYAKTIHRLLPHASRFSQQLMDMLGNNIQSEQANELHAAFHNLGVLYCHSGRGTWKEAEAMCSRAIAGREKSLGSHHHKTLAALNVLGVLYQEQGRIVDAEAILQRVLAARTDVLGPDHESTIQSVYNLAIIYSTQNKLDEAEKLYQRVLTWRQKALDPNDVRLLNVLTALGVLYRRQGKLAESEAMYLEALAGYEAALGTDHPSKLLVYNETREALH